jgi:hypothetical protein
MTTVAIPLDLAERILRLGEAFGEPFFSVIVGEGDGSINGIEEGRVCVFDAELSFVAQYEPGETAKAETLKELLNAITGDLSDCVRPVLGAKYSNQ